MLTAMNSLPTLCVSLSLVLASTTLTACKRSDVPPRSPEDVTGPADSADSVATADSVDSGSASGPEPCADLALADCTTRASALLDSDAPTDAIAPLTWACERGDGLACRNLVAAYQSGRLPAPEPGVAVGLAEAGCDTEDAESCMLLGVFYRDGELVNVDPNMAEAGFRAACDLDHANGCLALGQLLATGGTPTTAAAGLDRACELDPELCKPAGIVYLRDVGDGTGALAAFEAGCDHGDTEACFNIGVMHATGSGVPEDLAAGEAWMRKACEMGEPDACAAAEKIAAARDPNAIVGANLSVGSIEADGLLVQDLQCRLAGGGGLFGTMALVGLLAKKKKALDKCAPKGAAPTVRWDFAGGKTTVLDVDDPSDKVAACVEKVIAKVPATMEAECRATVLIGKRSAAEAAAAAR